MKLSGDFYLVSIEDVYLLLKDVQRYHITIYHLRQYNEEYFQFVSMHWQRQNIKRLLPYVSYHHSIGIFNFIRLFFSQKYRFVGIITAIIWFCFLSQLSYGCIIDNTYPQIKKELIELCNYYKLDQINYIQSEARITQLENMIKENMNEEIDYFDIYLDGHVYSITYTKKIHSNLKEISYTPLVATHDAVVDRIEVTSGNVLVEKGQYVSKGEMLVSNEIMTTSEEINFVSVEGKIYGYVYHTFEASAKGELNPDTYILLYQQISNLVKEQIGDDGRIIQENVLQYTKKEGKIVLRIQFTLYQNIAKKEFLNEE